MEANIQLSQITTKHRRVVCRRAPECRAQYVSVGRSEASQRAHILATVVTRRQQR
jgi:hypothetical protein